MSVVIGNNNKKATVELLQVGLIFVKGRNSVNGRYDRMTYNTSVELVDTSVVNLSKLGDIKQDRFGMVDCEVGDMIMGDVYGVSTINKKGISITFYVMKNVRVIGASKLEGTTLVSGSYVLPLSNDMMRGVVRYVPRLRESLRGSVLAGWLGHI